MDYISDNPYCKNEEAKANEIANRLRHEKSGKLRKKPSAERLNLSHESKHPPTGKDTRQREQEKQRSTTKQNQAEYP